MMINMPEDTKKSRSERNFEKRDTFYEKLNKISFDFDARTLDLKTFKERFSGQLGILARLCSYTRNNCKGSVTRKYLKLISDSANLCKAIIEKPIENRDNRLDYSKIKRIAPKSLYVPVEELYDLSDILIKTSRAYFPFLASRSTLDYKFTRDKLYELSSQIPDCVDTMLALSNECEINNLLRRINYINRNNENKAHHLWYENDYCNFVYRTNRKLQCEEFSHWKTLE